MTDLTITGAVAPAAATAAAATAAAATSPGATSADTAPMSGEGQPATSANPWLVEHKGRDGTLTSVEVPEPFRNADGTVNVAAALKAHADLRAQLSTRPTAPEKYDFAALVGDDLKPALGDVLADGAPLLPKAEAWGKKWSLPPEAMAEALGLLAERDGLLGQSGEQQAAQAQQQAWDEAIQVVGSKEKAEGIGRRFAAVLGLGPDDALSVPPKALPALERLLAKAGAGEIPANRGAAPAAAVTEADLEAMMKDPKYWKDKDPALIAQVTAGFQRLYGQKPA